MRQDGTRVRVLDRLMASLASAETGSRELDIIISFVLGATSGEAGRLVALLVEEGYPWDIVSELLDHDLPAYTSSLDAAIPGENIVLAIYSSRRRRWGAAHGTADGQHVLRWAATECLARRLAALSALIATAGQTAAAAPSDDSAPVEYGLADEPADSAPLPSEPAAESTDEAEPEWKILF
mgnify:CR=1 FL=1